MDPFETNGFFRADSSFEVITFIVGMIPFPQWGCHLRISILLQKYLYQLPLTPWSRQLCPMSLRVLRVFMGINCFIEKCH